MKTKAFFCLAAWLLLSALAPDAFAVTVTWTGGGDGYSWSDPRNWSTSALPGSSDDVVIPSIASNPTIQITAAAGTVKIHSLNSALAISISNGSLILTSPSVIAGQLSVSGASSSINANAQTTLLADNISVDQGAQVSFPNVTSYTVPAGMSVQWLVQHSGSTLSFPSLTSITGPSTPNTYLRLTTQYTDQGTGMGASPTLSLSALTTITKADDGDGYPNSGVQLQAVNGGTITAPNLATFNDNDSHPNSGMDAESNGTISAPKLLTPSGINISFNAQSHPEQFTSLVGTTDFEINSGTVTMSNLTSITGINLTVDQGAQVSFPNVTSYAVPAGMSVSWTVQHSGSVLVFPNLTSIAGPSTPNTYLRLDAAYNDQGTGTNTSPTLSLPALTTITKADDGDGYPNSGVELLAQAGGTITAPNLATFNDNDSHPNSGMEADDTAVISVPKLLAPKGVNIDFNALSHPEQFTSLVGTTSLEINSGAVTMSNLNTIAGLSTISIDQGAQVSFPNVTSYVVPAGMNVQWLVQHSGSVLVFPNLTSIAGPTVPNTYLNLSAQYNDQGTGTNTSPTLSLPALTTITKADDGDGYPNSGVSLNATNSGTLTAPNLTTFNDNDSHPNSSLTAYNGGVISVPSLMSVVGVSVNLGTVLNIATGQTYIGYGTIQNGVVNAGLLAVNAAGKTFQINGPLTSTGTVKVSNGGTLSVSGDFTLNGSGLLSLSVGSTLAITGDFLGTTTNTSGVDPLGTLLFNGTRTSVVPQHLEAMSKDLGAVAAGFSQNFVFGTFSLANNTYVQLVDQSHNTTSTTPECVYADSVVIPAGCTLDLNGLHLYARAVQLAGTVLHGTITQIPNAGALVLGTPTPGALSTAGELDEWTFYFPGGRDVSVLVNPGSTGYAVPISPQFQWANVQLLDSSNNVLASGFSANAGDTVSLLNVTIPTDGNYKIHINAPASHTAAVGNYTVGAWDSTPDTQSLTFNQSAIGNITAAFAVDQWTFSAVAGQQIQFQSSGSTTPGIVFALNGPDNYTAFTDYAGTTPLINLLTSGNYSLTAYGLNGATGGYSFVVKQTSVTPLALHTSYQGTWAGSGQAQLFSVPVTTINPLTVILTDPSSGDHTEVYARFGAPPTRETYDYASNGPGSNHGLLVPSAKVGTWYVLVYGESIPSGSGSYTVQANASEVVLSSNSTGQGVATANTTLTLTGAGFVAGTKVSLVGSNGTAYAATSSTTDLATQITATFAAGSVPAGTYAVEVTQPDGTTAILPSSIIIAATGHGILQTHLTVPNPIGRHIASTIYVTYSNVGNAAMPAPLLNVFGTNPSGVEGAFLTLDPALITQGFWTSATPYGYSQSVQILASGATPGVLQPGETMQVPIYYGGWINSLWSTSGTFNFYVASVQADDTTPVDWASLETSTRPASIPAAAWHIIYANLLSQLGTTSGGYVQLIDKNAIYLGQLGRNVTDISKLWSFAITQALGVFPTQDLASTTDDSLPTVGKLFLSFGRSFRNSIPGRFQTGPFGLGWVTPWQRSLSVSSDGTVTISLGGGSKSIYQPDSRYAGQYFSQAGDHSTLAAVSGGYQLMAVDGTIAFFSSTGQLSYLQDPNGNKITATYTGSYLTGLSASSGASFTIAYNGAGLIHTLTDTANRVTTYTYDAGNQYLISVLAYNGQTTSYGYVTTPGSPSLNALMTINLPSGLQENLSYDGSGRVMGITANNGAVPKTVAYSLGQVSITDPTPATSSVYFDENGQLAKTVDGLGNPTFFGHDSSYNLTSITNALGISTAYAYNNLGEVTAATDFLGNTTNFVYGGPQNQLTKLTDANGNNTIYSYNSTGQRTGTAFMDGSSESSVFDPLGNALSFINAASEPIAYDHYANGQLKSATFADGSSYSYVYDGEGHLTSATDATGAVTFTYDPTTRLLTKVAYPNGLWLNFTYYPNGQRKSMVDQTGFTTNYDYDALGRLSDLKDANGNVIVSYGYDGSGRLNLKTNSNGTYTTYLYYANGQLRHLVNYAPGGAVNSRFDDTYNALGLKSNEATLDGAWTYTYDADGQLTHAVFASLNTGKVPNQDLAYNYDAVGNRTSTLINGVTTAYVPNNMNRYSSVGGVPQSYDAKGNVLFDGVGTYTYSVTNQLLTSKSNSNSATFTYNSLGQRVVNNTSGQTTQFLIDPSGVGEPAGEFNQNGVAIAQYNYGVGLARQVASGTSYFYDADVLGSITGLVGTSGVYVNSYNYLPFGGSISSVESHHNPYQYLGSLGVTSDGNGLLFMRARYLDANLARFASVDPTRLSGEDVNFYRYAGNNPITRLDPAGQLSWETAGGLAALGIVTVAAFGPELAVLSAGYLLEEGLATVVGSELGLPELVGIGAQGIVDSSYFPWLSRGIVFAGGILGPETGEAPDSLDDFAGDIAGELLDRFLGGDGGNDGSNNNSGGGGGGDDGGLPGLPFPFPFPLPDPTPGGPYPLPGFPFPIPPGLPTYPGQPVDPNDLYGPSGYGAANYVTNMGNAFAYRITFENDPKANAPAQIVTIANNLSTSFDWSTFKLTGIGFGDFNLVIPPGSQHYETTLSMTYNGQTFNVQVETGIHSDTGQVYATFTSIDPNTGLPPSNVLTGFLPPENGTGRGEGYLTYTISPKSTVPNSTVIRNVAYITFDGNQPIATDQVDDDDPSKGTDPTKEAPVTVDTTIPTSHITSATPSTTSPTIAVAWTGSDVGGSGVASYSVYVSTDGGQTYAAWLTNTTLTSAVYQGTTGHTYYFYVAATSNVGTVQTTFQPVSATTYATYPPQITSALTATATTGKAFSYQIVASNSPASYAASGLPSGLSINTTTGLISGTPTQVGVFSVGLKATNAGGSGTATLTLTVDAPTYPAITSAGTAAAYLTEAFSYQITATNTPATYGATGLPSGLSINTASGLISGTPTQTGVFNVGLSATNAGGTGTLALVLTVNPAPMSPPAVTSALIANAQATVAFSYQITASNMPSAYGATGLPAGLTINTASGLISGTPTTVGTYPVTLSATNTGGTGTATLTLTVAAAPVVFPTITSAVSASTIVGYSFSYQITATNNPYSYAANGLPAGLSVNTATGLISGAPTTVGIYNISLGATNSGGTGTATLTLAVNAQPVPAPVITSVLAANGQATVGFSYQITASNSPVSFNASGLPAGLTVNTASGLISGAPTAAGVYSIVLSAANSSGTGTATLTLTIANPPAHAAFFTGEVPLSNGVYYLSFPNGNYFGYYSYLNVPGDPHYLYHFDMGYEYIFDAADGHNGVYFYDFKSDTFFYTSPVFPFPYLYDFTLNSVLYYYPDPNNPGRYNTNGYRFFYDFNTGKIIVK